MACMNKINKRNKSLWYMLKYEAKQFCLNTALHGYRFIVLPKRILLERVIWIIVVIISLTAGLSLLCIAWVGIQQNPTLLVTDSTHYPIWYYPFPAITVCSFNKISKSEAYRLAEQMRKPSEMTTDDLVNDFRLLVQLTFNNNLNIPFKNYSKLQDILEFNGLNIDNVMQRLAPSCEHTLQRCKWKGEEKRCESIFEQVRTSEGYCCTFNYYALKNHNFSGTVARKVPKNPRRVSACGYQTALEVLLNTNVNDQLISVIPAYGNLVLLHNSYNFPDWTSQNLLNPIKHNILIGVSPTITYSTQHIRKLDIEKRKCIFHDEKILHNFARYTYHNCLVECRMNISLKLCGCIPFFYYNPKGTYPKSKLCNLNDIYCLKENQHLLLSSIPGFDLSARKEGHIWGSGKNKCGCLPDCEYVSYLTEASSAVLSREFSSNQLQLFGGIKIENQSIFRVYFNDLVALKNRRDVSFSWHTLLAYYGGLLGLFVGFSFVSGIEIVYFFTIRLISDISNDKQNKINVKNSPIQINVKPNEFQILDAKNLKKLPRKRRNYYYNSFVN